jgi:two-component system heavy metal sensor histidine kinase CusS
MRRSLKLRQFGIIFTMTVAVVLMSRNFAQFRVDQQFREDLHTDMQSSLMVCAHASDDTVLFLKCQRLAFKNKLFKLFAGDETLCKNGMLMGEQGDQSTCGLLVKADHFWLSRDQSTESSVQLVVNTLDGQLWHVARLKSQPEIQIMIQEQALNEVMEAVFKVRDNQLPLFIPLLLLAGLLMAHFVIQATLSPLEELKRSLENLKPENFESAPRIVTPYREFDDFTAVYHQLLQRLEDSFTKAKRFSADAAHEMRTPLAILRGQAESLIADAPTGSSFQVRLRSIADEIERLIDISEKLLLLAKADAHLMGKELTDFNISEFIEQLVEDSTLYHPSLRIDHAIEPDLIWHCDPSLAQQLIHNLYSNAVKYNITQGWIKFTLRSDGDMLELMLENPASHIPIDLREKAFDRFYRGDTAHNRRIDGSGLGLSICKEIALLHQGTLSLEPTPRATVMATLRVPLNSMQSEVTVSS